jgi:Protein of unknown function (DUF998)
VLLGAALLVLLHVFSKRLSPLSQPISNYALTRDGWLFDLAISVLALGLATLLCALVAGELVELGSGSFVVTATCCVCLVILVVCPDQGSGGGLPATRWVHWASAMVAFGALLVTPVVLGGRHRSHTGCRGYLALPGGWRTGPAGGSRCCWPYGRGAGAPAYAVTPPGGLDFLTLGKKQSMGTVLPVRRAESEASQHAAAPA